MQIPNADRAIVEEAKIVHYLLNPAHPENGGKAAFFTSLGFSKAQWQVLADALRMICVSGTVTNSVESVHGSKYVVDGLIQAPRTGDALLRRSGSSTKERSIQG